MTRRRTRKVRSKKMTAVRSAICGGQSSLGLVLDQWLRERRTAVGRHQKLLLEEIEGRRDEILDRLREVVSSHYVALEITTKRLADLGATKTAELLRQELPLSKRARSGDIGEILATEFVEQVLHFKVPIRRLQWKDGREMALRGDDIVAFAAGQDDKLRFLKGEAKSRAKLAATVVEEAATALDRDKGRPTRHSVLFVAKRLRERGEDYAATMLRVKDHGDFIRCLYEEM